MIGEYTRTRIRGLHSGDEWRDQLYRVYQTISQLDLNAAAVAAPVPRRPGETDLLLTRLYAGQAPLGWVIGWYGSICLITSGCGCCSG